MHGVDASHFAPGNGAQPAPQPRLVKSAHEFEAQMMKELLRPLTAGDALSGEDDDSDTGSTGALGGFASEALGAGLSEQGGFGIANKIIGELSQHGTVPDLQNMTRKLQRNPSLGGTK
jgi:Rod binding domain-containing protein